jgi:hypothetical protein
LRKPESAGEFQVIADRLRNEIDGYIQDRWRGSNRLFDKARRGELRRDTVISYLWNILYALRQTPGNLELAKRVAAERGENELASYFEQKLNEEIGHCRWAEADLRSLDPNLDPTHASEPLEPISELFQFLTRAIEENPAQYLAYMLFVEYFTTAVGPQWLALLDSGCGIPGSSMTAIGHHVELDKDHVEDDLEVIRKLVRDDPDAVALEATLRASIAYWDRFFEHLADCSN